MVVEAAVVVRGGGASSERQRREKEAEREVGKELGRSVLGSRAERKYERDESHILFAFQVTNKEESSVKDR